MAMGPRLDLRQSQSLVMTPQLQQAIRLLALSNLEVEAFIAEEIEKNPLLETDREEPPESIEALSAEERREGADVLLDTSSPGETDSALDVDMTAETFHHDSASDGGPGLDGRLGLSGESSGSSFDDGPDFDAFEAEAPSLHAHLQAQAGATMSGVLLLIANQLIDHIDESGYLAQPLLEFANRLAVPLAQVEEALEAIQCFDPTGVGARNLGECLALQAREVDRLDPAMARLLDNLDLLAEGRIAQLKRMCDVDDEDMQDMIRELRSYDPKPGLRFGAAPIGTVTPDIFVAKRAGGWSIEINSATLPRLLINRSYYTELSGGSQDKASKAWLADCMTNASWLIKALDQRQRTIIKVATEIVKHQEAFFKEGVAHLRPLTLRMIAETIDMHESTVSRVTSNKYLSCSRGMFELKYFFTSGVAAADGGEAVSAEAVKNAIRMLIMTEDPHAILSDDTLVELLHEKGFDLARRTVAKYREAIGLGSSVQRRRQKAIMAQAA
jgi:RNA polymerase sigma-54 factor